MELYISVDITLITICDKCNTIFHILKQSVRDSYRMKTVSPTLLFRSYKIHHLSETN